MNYVDNWIDIMKAIGAKVKPTLTENNNIYPQTRNHGNKVISKELGFGLFRPLYCMAVDQPKLFNIVSRHFCFAKSLENI